MFSIEKCQGGLAIRKANPLSASGTDIVGRVYHVGLKMGKNSQGGQVEIEEPLPRDDWKVDLCGETPYGDLVQIMDLLKSYDAK